MIPFTRYTFCLTLILGFSLPCAAAQVYKWTDAKGQTHFGNTPPENVNARPISIAPTPAPNSHLEERKQKLENQEQRQHRLNKWQKEEQQANDQAKQRDEQRQKICAEYEKNLQLLEETGRRVYTVDSHGKYHYFDDEQREREIEQTKQDFARYCTSSSK